jgi:DNA-directed RNA polymerase subunit beta'
MNQIRRIASSRDTLIIDERQKHSNAEAADAMLEDMSNEGTPAE